MDPREPEHKTSQGGSPQGDGVPTEDGPVVDPFASVDALEIPAGASRSDPSSGQASTRAVTDAATVVGTSLAARVVQRLALVMAVLLVALLLITDALIRRMVTQLESDATELSDGVSVRADAAFERHAMRGYVGQARQQAHTLDWLFRQVAASVEQLAEFAARGRDGRRAFARLLPSSAFADPQRRPDGMRPDPDRALDVSWTHLLWHAPGSADPAAVRADLATAGALLDSMAALGRNQGHLLNLYAGYPSGAIVVAPGSAAFVDKVDYDPTLRGWYTDAIREDVAGPVWGLPYIDVATGQLTMSCSQAFPGPDGARAGVVGVDLSLAALQRWLEMLADEEAFDAYLVDRMGQVVFHQSYDGTERSWDQDFEVQRFLDGADEAQQALLLDLADLVPGVRRLTLEGDTWVMAHSPIAAVDWNLVLSFSGSGIEAIQTANQEQLGEAFTEAQRTTARRMKGLRVWFLVSVLAVCAVLIISVGWTLDARFRRPIRQIIRDIRVVSTGDLDHQVQHDSDDELGALSRAFNSMTAQLAATRDEVRSHAQTLERRVDERTVQLARRNEQLADLYEEAEQSFTQLKATQAQLVQHERMATLGQLVAGIAHEINNPVNFLINSVRPLRQVTAKIENVLRLYESTEQLPPDAMADRIERIAEYKRQLGFETAMSDLNAALELIGNGAERTSQIVENLRVFSRTEQTVHKPVDLRRGIDITVSLLSHQLKGRVTVHRDYRRVPTVECNPSQINQVFMNLLSNAAQAIEEEGDIWIQVKRAGNYVRVRIRDNGCGIPEEHLYRVFEPFFTTKGEVQGTGLGLSISHNIVQDHGGTIEVRSEPGKGTEFTVSLPITQQSGSYSSYSEESEETSPPSTQQIPIYLEGERPRVVGVGESPLESGPRTPPTPRPLRGLDDEVGTLPTPRALPQVGPRRESGDADSTPGTWTGETFEFSRETLLEDASSERRAVDDDELTSGEGGADGEADDATVDGPETDDER